MGERTLAIRAQLWMQGARPLTLRRGWVFAPPPPPHPRECFCCSHLEYGHWFRKDGVLGGDGRHRQRCAALPFTAPPPPPPRPTPPTTRPARAATLPKPCPRPLTPFFFFFFSSPDQLRPPQRRHFQRQQRQSAHDLGGGLSHNQPAKLVSNQVRLALHAAPASPLGAPISSISYSAPSHPPPRAISAVQPCRLLHGHNHALLVLFQRQVSGGGCLGGCCTCTGCASPTRRHPRSAPLSVTTHWPSIATPTQACPTSSAPPSPGCLRPSRWP